MYAKNKRITSLVLVLILSHSTLIYATTERPDGYSFQSPPGEHNDANLNNDADVFRWILEEGSKHPEMFDDITVALTQDVELVILMSSIRELIMGEIKQAGGGCEHLLSMYQQIGKTIGLHGRMDKLNREYYRIEIFSAVIQYALRDVDMMFDEKGFVDGRKAEYLAAVLLGFEPKTIMGFEEFSDMFYFKAVLRDRLAEYAQSGNYSFLEIPGSEKEEPVAVPEIIVVIPKDHYYEDTLDIGSESMPGVPNLDLDLSNRDPVVEKTMVPGWEREVLEASGVGTGLENFLPGNQNRKEVYFSEKEGVRVPLGVHVVGDTVDFEKEKEIIRALFEHTKARNIRAIDKYMEDSNKLMISASGKLLVSKSKFGDRNISEILEQYDFLEVKLIFWEEDGEIVE